MKAEKRHLELVGAGQKEIAVVYEVGVYNEKRFSKPWIATITNWEIGSYPRLEFGASCENSAECAARVGDIVKYGQKDYRGHRGKNSFGIVLENGRLERITEAQAKEIFRAKI